MSCKIGDGSCDTRRRRGALTVLGIMMGIFVVLSVFSFHGTRKQALPKQILYGSFDADAGKRVFQAYNCMGCHTIVGNGAYFGPDLTDIYRKTGPAWLEAFLPSAGSWPTAAAVKTQLVTTEQQAAAGVASFEEYEKQYPGVAERIDRRGGTNSHMPNLPFKRDEVGKLIAFLKYTSAMNTEGWPPRIESGDLPHRLRLAYRTSMQAPGSAGQAAAASNETATASTDPVSRGARLVKDYGCIACHATDKTRMVGPGWGGLHGSQVKLADGSTVAADNAYLAESILHPNSQIVEGFQPGLMPAYDTLLKPEDVEAIVAYLASLSGKGEQR